MKNMILVENEHSGFFLIQLVFWRWIEESEIEFSTPKLNTWETICRIHQWTFPLKLNPHSSSNHLLIKLKIFPQIFSKWQQNSKMISLVRSVSSLSTWRTTFQNACHVVGNLFAESVLTVFSKNLLVNVLGVNTKSVQRAKLSRQIFSFWMSLKKTPNGRNALSMERAWSLSVSRTDVNYVLIVVCLQNVRTTIWWIWLAWNRLLTSV